MRRKKVIVLPHLVDAGGDLTKDWFVEYSCRDPRTDKLKRFREYAGLGRQKSAKERHALAEQIIRELKDKLATGWVPFQEEKLTYQDELILQVHADRWGRERESLPTSAFICRSFSKSRRLLSFSIPIKHIGLSCVYLQNGQSIRNWIQFISVVLPGNIFVIFCSF